MGMNFHGDYLRELQALDDFLARRRGAERFVEPEDPDVRRLMESLAFFSARTREAATAQLRGAVHRLAHGLLDEFVDPQPARAMLQAKPSPRLTEPARLPRGSRIRLETLEGDIGQFSTMREVTIRPLELDRAELQLRGSGFRVLLRLRAFGPMAEIAEPLSMHIDHLGDYEISRQLFGHLRGHLDQVSVVYGDAPSPSELGRPCTFDFGTQAGQGAAAMEHSLRSQQRAGAIAGIREFLHFPNKELCINVALAPVERPWRQAWLCLDFDEWPEGQIVNRDMFRLFMVPIENLFTEPAEPIKCDGTRARYPITAWSVDADVRFHSIVEVQQDLSTGMSVILPGHLSSSDESWELEFDDEQGAPHLLLRLPSAFLDPRIVMVRARWYQPRFDDLAFGKLEPKLYSRHLEGVAFRIHGGLTPSRVSPLHSDPTAMLHVLSRRSKRILSREDIVKMMTVLGADAHSYYGDIAGDLRNVEAHDEPADIRSGAGIQHVYRVRCAEAAAERRGLLDDYLRCLGQLLDEWSNNPARIVRDEPARRTRDAGTR